MYVLQPVWQYYARLDGFETAAFWIAAFTGVIIAGFLVDYILQKQGFGVFFNSLVVTAGILAGLWVRFAYAKPSVIPLADPILSIVVILSVTTLMITMLSLLRNRFY